MILKEITRTISGPQYSNISIKAELHETDNVLECAKQLDIKLRECLKEIDKQNLVLREKRESLKETNSLLTEALNYAQKQADDLPF